MIQEPERRLFSLTSLTMMIRLGGRVMKRIDSDRRQTLRQLSALTLAPLLPAGALASTVSAIHALPRFALVIGNSRYAEAPLKNPANDASAIAEELKRFGFAVSMQLDARRSAMEEGIRAFNQGVARQKGVGLFYFAGHGLQLSWRNFLVPVDAVLDHAESVPRQAIDLTTLLDGLNKAGNPMNIVILDACRDNPFGSELKTGKGLSQMDAPLGTLLAYATAPGNVASDGASANGLYTEHLLREMRTPEARIEDVFKRVRLGVRRASNGRQIPWESTSLEEDFYFLPPASLKKLSQEELDRRFAEERALWERARQSMEAARLEEYIRRYPSGRFVELAQMRLDRILARQGEERIRIASPQGNPFSKGTVSADTHFRIGDRFSYQRVDLLTRVVTSTFTMTVTAIDDTEVIYDKGVFITDLLGNAVKLANGERLRSPQLLPTEFAVGKKWRTRYRLDYPDGRQDWVEYDFKVVARETVVVPAGTFDAFRVEGKGWVMGIGFSLDTKYWVAPDKVRRAVAYEFLWRERSGRIYKYDREELVSYKHAP